MKQLVLLLSFSFIFLFFFGLVVALPLVDVTPAVRDIIVQNQTVIQTTTADTNATTECPDSQFLRGDGTCQTLTGGGDFLFTDFQASFNLNITGIDTNATTECGDAEFLRGDGTCQTISGSTNTWEANLTNGVSADLNPLSNLNFNFGTSILKWLMGHFGTINADDGNIKILNVTEINASNWNNVSIVESQIRDLTHTTPGNLSFNETRTNELYALIGAGGNSSFNQTLTDGLYSNFSLRNIFNQTLNTTSNVQFANATIGNNLTVLGRFFAKTYITEPTGFRFNFYDDGSDTFMNVSNGGGDFSIEQDNSKIVLANSPGVGNDFMVFQLFSKQATDITEFVITKAGAGHTSYFIRSLALTGNGTFIPTPFDCQTFAQFIDCDTDLTGPDMYILDDLEVNGTIFVKEDIQINGTNVGLFLYNQTIMRNIFDQNLNTTDIVKFGNISTNNLTANNLTIAGLLGCTGKLITDANGLIVCGVDSGGTNTWELNLTNGVSADLIPLSDSNFNLGSVLLKWLKGHFTELVVEGDLNVTDGNNDFFVDVSTGRVGIGTEVPQTILELLANNPQITFNDTGSLNIIIGNVNGDFEIRNESGGILMVIEQAGNVGIGSSSPATLLELEGKNIVLNIENTDGASIGNGGVLRFGHDQVSSILPLAEIRAELVNGNGVGARAGDLSFWTSTAGVIGEAMRIIESGFVGIGVETPSNRLHIREDNSVNPLQTAFFQNIGGADAGIIIGVSATNWTIGIDNNNDDKLMIVNNNQLANDGLFTIQTDGKIGIGITSPTHLLTVDGDIKVTGVGNCIVFDSGGKICSG